MLLLFFNKAEIISGFTAEEQRRWTRYLESNGLDLTALMKDKTEEEKVRLNSSNNVILHLTQRCLLIISLFHIFEIRSVFEIRGTLILFFYASIILLQG